MKRLPVWVAMVFGAKYWQQEAEEKHHQTQAYQTYYWKESNFIST